MEAGSDKKTASAVKQALVRTIFTRRRPMTGRETPHLGDYELAAIAALRLASI
jgi:hypothetical protein